MQLLLQALIFFFGTLLVAGVVALAEPRQGRVTSSNAQPAVQARAPSR